MTEQSESAVERRRPDWWALEPAVTERRDIVDELSDATGYFHDDEAAKLRDIASDSGTKPVGIVRAAVEKEIENLEWRCVYFDNSEERGYISSNAYEFYRIHRKFELEYEAAIEALPKEENPHLREVQVFEHAADRLEDEARKHRAKREQAERFLTENGFELPEVEDPRPDSDEPELVTDGGKTESSSDEKHPAARNSEQLAWAVWSDDGRSRACYAVVADSEKEALDKARERHGSPLDNANIDGPFQNAEPGVFEFEYITEHRETIVVEAPTEEYARESADANRNYSGQYMETLHIDSRQLDAEVSDV